MNYAGNPYHFRQDSSFLYYFGIDRPHLAATMDLASGNTTLYGEDYTLDDVVWMGPQPSLAELAGLSGGMQLARPQDLDLRLQQAIRSEEPVHFLPPYRAENLRYLMHQWNTSAEQIASMASEALIRAVAAQRNLKQEEEILQLSQACDRTTEMHLTAMRTARPGLLESAVMAAVRQVPLSYGSDVAYPIICSRHGEILHNHAHDNMLRAGDLLLLDAGSESTLHYAGDSTRTIPVSGRFDDTQKALYQLVLDSQRSAIDALRPGVKYYDVHLLAAKVIASGLKDLGLMRGDTDEAVAAGAHALFFPHGLGHMIGLDVHDMEDLGEQYVGYGDGTERSTQFGLKALRLGQALQAGNVITVEPGCYFIPALIDRWQAEKRFEAFLNYQEIQKFRRFGGIRIEDDLLITEGGARILGEPLPKTVAEVEAVMQG